MRRKPVQVLRDVLFPQAPSDVIIRHLEARITGQVGLRGNLGPIRFAWSGLVLNLGVLDLQLMAELVLFFKRSGFHGLIASRLAYVRSISTGCKDIGQISIDFL